MHRIVPKGYDEIIRDPRGFTAIASISLRELVAPFGCSLSTNIFININISPNVPNLHESGSFGGEDIPACSPCMVSPCRLAVSIINMYKECRACYWSQS